MIFAFGHDKYTLYQNVANVAKLWFNEHVFQDIVSGLPTRNRTWSSRLGGGSFIQLNYGEIVVYSTVT